MMKKFFSSILSIILISAMSTWNISSAIADQIDVGYLQTCLKTEGSSLDVLVLMDSSASMRDAKPGETWHKPQNGSDPERVRGKILKSSLKLLRTLAQESDRNFNINLRNFGKNSDPKEHKVLEEHWVPWTSQTSDRDLDKFVEKALYDDSHATEWAAGLATAQNQFKQRLGQAEIDGKKSCPIMFWITDGAPTDSVEPICANESSSSMNWFRKNNVLVLGGLLQPQGRDRVDASKFKPIVEGENCGSNEEGWTKGVVIKADQVSDLAWGFVGLIASIKNLVDLKPSGSKFYVDPGTSQIDVYVRGDQNNWQISRPDGSIVCSSSNRGDLCEVNTDPEIGITTVSVFPEQSNKNVGNWSFSPAMTEDSYKVYAGLSTSSKRARNNQPRLVVNPPSKSDAEEGKDLPFQVKIVNADKSDFSINGFRSINICAKLQSSSAGTCKSGSPAAELTVNPTQSDKNVAFEAILVSSNGEDREYRIAASAAIEVIPSGLFPSLKCEKEPCQLTAIKNKNKAAVSKLEVVTASNGSTNGRVTLIGYNVLSDQIENRGDGHFRFEARRPNGEIINWNSPADALSPGQKIELTVTTDMGGDSPIQGVIKYKVEADGQELVRQLQYKFNVGSESNKLIQILLLLIAYLITVGLPYLYLLWSARRAAVLNVPDGEFSFISLPFTISKSGEVRSSGELPPNVAFAPDYKSLEKRTLELGAREVTIGSASISVIPPKYNPFAATNTVVAIPGSFILTTIGDQGLQRDSAKFNSSLINEAIFAFSAEGNIDPVRNVSEELVTDDGGLSFLESSYETKINDVTVSPDREVSGSAIFIVSHYVLNGLNREKSLLELASKLTTSVKAINWTEKVAELRASALSAEIDRQAAEKLQAEQADAKMPKKIKEKKAEKTTENAKPQEEFEDEDWSRGSSSYNRNNDLPDSGKSSDSW